MQVHSIGFDSSLPKDRYSEDKVCRPCWRIHLQEGCLHRCHYCGYGGLLAAMVNVEEYCEHLGQIIRRHPWQTTYLLDDDADPPGFEVVVAGGVYPAKADSAGFVRMLSRSSSEILADIRLEAPVVYDGIAVAGERIVASLKNGAVVSLARPVAGE